MAAGPIGCLIRRMLRPTVRKQSSRSIQARDLGFQAHRLNAWSFVSDAHFLRLKNTCQGSVLFSRPQAKLPRAILFALLRAFPELPQLRAQRGSSPEFLFFSLVLMELWGWRVLKSSSPAPLSLEIPLPKLTGSQKCKIPPAASRPLTSVLGSSQLQRRAAHKVASHDCAELSFHLAKEACILGSKKPALLHRFRAARPVPFLAKSARSVASADGRNPQP